MTEDLRPLGDKLLGKTSGNMKRGEMRPGGGKRMFRKEFQQINWP